MAMLVRPAALSPAGGFDTIPPPVSHSPSGTRPNYTHSGGAALPMISVSVGARDSCRALPRLGCRAPSRRTAPTMLGLVFLAASRAAAFLAMAVRNRGPCRPRGSFRSKGPAPSIGRIGRRPNRSSPARSKPVRKTSTRVVTMPRRYGIAGRTRKRSRNWPKQPRHRPRIRACGTGWRSFT